MDSEKAYDINRRDAERAHERANADQDRIDEAAVSTGIFAIRTTLLINGGAAVAILAFIGGLVGQGKVGLGQQLTDTASSLMWFAWGVVAGGISAGAAYFVNYFTSEHVGAIAKHWDHPYLRPTPSASRWWIARAIAQMLAVVAGVASLVFFVVGMIDVKQSIERLGKNAASMETSKGKSNPATVPTE